MSDMSELAGHLVPEPKEAKESETLLSVPEKSPGSAPSPPSNCPARTLAVGGHAFTRKQATGLFTVGLVLAAMIGFAVTQIGRETNQIGREVVVKAESKSKKSSSSAGPCKLKVVKGVAEFADPEKCDSDKKMPAECAKPGENCSESKCCAWGGMTCFSKDKNWASCKNDCVPGPDFSEEKMNNWTCKALGPKTPGKGLEPDEAAELPEWVGQNCSKPGVNCLDTGCCAWGGMQCYRKDDNWASCRWQCQDVDFTEESYNQWSCETVGPRTPGEVKDAPEVKDLPVWVSEKCAEDGKDCSKVGCCQSPGTQCYEKTKGWAVCQETCEAGPHFTDVDETPWTCRAIGPRTPGQVEASKAPPKFTLDSLPDWVGEKCTETGPKDCSKTMCCKDPKMQCFQKEEGWAVCEERCFPGVDPNDKTGGNWSCKALGPRTPRQCPACAPKYPTAPDVIIPFFERDLCKLKYTAKSLGVNDPEGHLGDVYLMWISSHSPSEYQGEIDQALDLIRNGPHGKTATLIDFSGRMANAKPHPIAGWHAQQMAKLKMASVVQTDFYMVMDSKNTLIRPVTGDLFFTECNQALIQAEFPWYKIPVPHSDWYERSSRVLNVGKPDSGFWPASITPIVLHRQTVLDMLKGIGEDPSAEQLCSGPLCEQIGAFSDSGHGATEFTLYTLHAYAKRDSGDFECIHEIDAMKRFKLKYSDDWRKELEQKLREQEFPADKKQITVSSQDGYPIDWTPAEEFWAPPEDQFPLKFEDLTRKWAASLWRGEPSNAGLLVEVNLHTLHDVVHGIRQFPIMFGAQPASLNPMDGTDNKDKAVNDMVKMYMNANLYDESDPDLIGCVVGYKN